MIIDEARDIHLARTKDPEGGIILIRVGAKNVPFLMLLPVSGHTLFDTLSFTIIIIKTTLAKKYLSKHHRTDPEFVHGLVSLAKGRYNDTILSELNKYPAIFTISTTDSRAYLYKFLTTDLRISDRLFTKYIGEPPENLEQHYLKFGSVKILFMDNMKDRIKASIQEVLAMTERYLIAHNISKLFNGIIRIVRLPGITLATYVPSSGSINLSPNSKLTESTILTLLHEFGHKFYNEFLSDQDRFIILKMYRTLIKNFSNDSAVRQETAAKLKDSEQIIKQIENLIKPGMKFYYKGKDKYWKNEGHPLVIKSIGAAVNKNTGKRLTVLAVYNDGDPNQTVIGKVGISNFVYNNNKWPLPQQIEPMISFPKYERADSKIRSDWFPTKYSETEHEEWFCELFSYHLVGQLSGDPHKWMKQVILSHNNNEDIQLNDSIGGNSGEHDAGPDLDYEGVKMLPTDNAVSDSTGAAGWDWTDPYHTSGAENAVLSNTP